MSENNGQNSVQASSIQHRWVFLIIIWNNSKKCKL